MKAILCILNLKHEKNQISILRTANFFGINTVFVLGEKLKKSEKQCMSSHRNMKIRYFSMEWELINSLKSKGYELVLMELNNNSVPVETFKFPEKCAIMTGHENMGFSDELLNSADHVVHISKGETKVKSLNTAIACGIGLYEYFKQWNK